MNTSAILQAQFQTYVLAGEDAIVQAIATAPRLDARARLDIYANGYRRRLIDILETDYPALHTLAGDDLFDQLARAYIAAHPSVFPNARWFGMHLPQFLLTDERFSLQPVLTEMAKFEWAMGLAFDAADDAVLDIAELAGLPGEAWAELGFHLHASLQQIQLEWNVPAFWRAVALEQTPPTPERSMESMPWIVWRRALTTYFRSLETDEAAALDTLQHGGNFAEMCERLCEWHAPEQIPVRAMGLLKRWVEEGLVSRIKSLRIPNGVC